MTAPDEPAGITKEEAERIRDEQALSLAHLAGKVGISSRRSRGAVAVAVVTGPLGVLMGLRATAEPGLSWSFPGGKIEPFESPESAAIREAFEEAGLTVRAGRVIGQRIHPSSGVLVTYVGCSVVSGEAGVTGELTEVRWVSPDRADELTNGTIYEPVRAYLRREQGD